MEIKQVVHKVAIVGGGLGGLATAIALRKQGIDAQVYERAKEFRPVGANSTFEDAYELAQCLSQSSSIAEALTTYENRRIPRTQAIQARSALGEQHYYATDIGTQDLEKAARERVAFEEFQHWVYGYDPKSESRFQPWTESVAT